MAVAVSALFFLSLTSLEDKAPCDPRLSTPKLWVQSRSRKDAYLIAPEWVALQRAITLHLTLLSVRESLQSSCKSSSPI